MDQPFKDQPRRDLLDQTDQETLFHDLYLALDESPVEGESLPEEKAEGLANAA